MGAVLEYQNARAVRTSSSVVKPRSLGLGNYRRREEEGGGEGHFLSLRPPSVSPEALLWLGISGEKPPGIAHGNNRPISQRFQQCGRRTRTGATFPRFPSSRCSPVNLTASVESKVGSLVVTRFLYSCALLHHPYVSACDNRNHLVGYAGYREQSPFTVKLESW